MKKTVLFVAGVLCLALLSSCNKEEVPAPAAPAAYGPMSVTLNYDEVVKTSFNQGETALEQVWKAGDEIAVIRYNVGSVEKFTLVSGAGTKTATFSREASALAAIESNEYVTIMYPYFSGTESYWWKWDISNQGSGSLSNLGNYNLLGAFNVKVNYVADGDNYIAATNFEPLTWILRLPAGLQIVSGADEDETISSLAVSGTNLYSVKKVSKTSNLSTEENGSINLSGIALKNGCLVNDVYISIMSGYGELGDSFNLAFTLQSNGVTYNYPYTHTGKYFFSGKTYKMTQSALISTTGSVLPKSDKQAVQLWADGPYWATTNLGAATPEEYGQFFAWGYAEGCIHDGTYWVLASDGTTKVPFSDSQFPNRNSETFQDAATANWGSGWRMPTSDELGKLINSSYCTVTYVTEGTPQGITITGNTAGYTDKSIFLPAAGNGSGWNHNVAGTYGFYRSSDKSLDYAYILYFVPSTSTAYIDERGLSLGNAIRPVRDSAL